MPDMAKQKWPGGGGRGGGRGRGGRGGGRGRGGGGGGEFTCWGKLHVPPVPYFQFLLSFCVALAVVDSLVGITYTVTTQYCSLLSKPT